MYQTFLPQLKPIQRAPSPDTSDSGMSDSTDATILIPASEPPSKDDDPGPFTSFSRKKENPIPPLHDFLSPIPAPVNAFVHNHEATPSEKTASTIREMQRRFVRGTPDHGGDNCTALDRRTVLDIYAEAIDTLNSAPGKHVLIAAECTRKVRVVLSIIASDPDDTVFLTAGQLLSPLEPQYANPRIDRGDDQYGYRAQWRLHAWRKEGWPQRYPEKAIDREAKTKGEGLVGKGKMNDLTIMEKVLTTNEMWEDGDKTLESMNEDAAEDNETRSELAVKDSRTGRARTMFSGPHIPPIVNDDGYLVDADDSNLIDEEDNNTLDAEESDLEGVDDDWS
jgi:hypothetical protein